LKRKLIALGMSVVILCSTVINVNAEEFSENIDIENTDDLSEEVVEDQDENNNQDVIISDDNEEVEDIEIFDDEESFTNENEDENTEITIEAEEDAENEASNDVTEFASDDSVEITATSVSGKCGDNMTWRIENHILTITGSGEMYDGAVWGGPWGQYGEMIMATLPFGYDTVIVGEGVTSLCDRAFIKFDQYWMGVKSIYLPSTLKKIGAEAFKGNEFTDNENFVLPSSVTSIGDNAFEDSGIRSLDLRNLSITKLPVGIVKNCDNLEQVMMPESITQIGERAFENCDLIKKVELPSKVEEIEKGAFMNCDNLEYIKIPETVKMARCEDGLREFGIFTGSPKLKTAGCGSGYNIDICCGKDSKLPYDIFAFADYVEEIDIPEGIKGFNDTWSYGEFRYSKKLRKVTFPESFESLKGRDFIGCSSLEEVNIPKGTKKLDGTFHECSSLKTIEIPDGVLELERTFSGCSSLEKIQIPSSVEGMWGTFYNCSSLKKVIIPDTVRELSANFEGCTALNSAGPIGSGKAIEYGWTQRIPEYAFSYSDELQEVIFPETLTEIGWSAFRECKKLEQVFLPYKLEEISWDLFNNCTSLKTVRIPENVKCVRDSAFENCSALKNIYFRADAPQIEDANVQRETMGAFAGDTLNAYFPDGNTTWTRKVCKDYGGKIIWKPYVKGKALDDSKERTVTIKGGGRASVRFYLCDENGDVIPENVFEFYGHSISDVKKNEEKKEQSEVNENIKSKEKIDDNVLNVIGSGEVMTDFDGGYSFYTPYYEYQSSGNNEYQILYEASWNNEKGEKQHETFTVNIKVEAMSYTETWTAALEPSISMGGSYASVSASTGNESEISIKHKADGSEDLILKLKVSKAVSTELKQQLNDKNMPDFPTGVSLLSVSNSKETTEYNTYATVIENYDPDNKEDNERLAVYMETLLFIHGDKSESVLTKSVLRRAITGILFEQFSVSEGGIKIKLSGSASVLDLKLIDTSSLINKIKLNAVNNDTTYVSSVESDVKGDTKYTGSLESSDTFSLLSGSFSTLLGITGIKGFHNINSEGITIKGGRNTSLSYSESCYESGNVEIVGYDELHSKQAYTIEAADDLVKEQNLTKQANGMNVPIDSAKISKIGEIIKNSGLEYTYTVEDELKNTYSWSPSLDLGAGVDIEAKLSYSHGWSTETYKGEVKEQTVLWESDSSNSIKRAKEDATSDKIDTILFATVKGIGVQLASTIGSISGEIGEVLSYGAAKVTTAASDVLDWTVSVVGRTVTAVSSEAESFNVYTISSENALEMVRDGNTDQAVSAQTVGEAFIVKVKDENENELSDISDANMKITLNYNEDELKAAGRTMDNASDLAIYRYDDLSGIYIYIGGEIDYENQQLTASIDKTGEYVLIVDGASPNITNINVINKNGKPVIKANILDLSGIQSVDMKIDGIEKVNADNFRQYYDVKTGEFLYNMEETLAYGDHTISFWAVDKKGKQTDQVDYLFSVNGLPEFTEITVPHYVLWDEDVEISAQATSPDDDPLVITASVIAKGNSSQYKKRKLKCELIENDSVWRGKFTSIAGYDDYEVTFTVSNGKGDEVTSEAFQCKINHGEDCEITEENVKYDFNILTNTITDITTSEENLVIPEEIYGRKVLCVNAEYFDCNNIKCITIPSYVTQIYMGTYFPEGLVIKGEKYSAAYYYAEINKLKFVPLGECDDQGYTEDYMGLTWHYEKNILTISGNDGLSKGMMDKKLIQYFGRNIKKIVIQEGITWIKTSFSETDFSKLREIEIAKSVSEIEYKAFEYLNEDLIIYGYYKSAAYEYAISNGIQFEGLAPAEGAIGKEVSWNYWKGVLTISGRGELPTYEADSAPWLFAEEEITKIVVEEGITAIGERVFADLEYVNEVQLSDTLNYIGKYAFLNCTRLTSILIPDSVSVIEECAIGYEEDWNDEISKKSQFVIRGTTDVVKKYAENNDILFLDPATYWNIAESEIQWQKQVEYTEDQIRPSYISVWFSGTRLEEDVDYIINYENNNDIGIGHFTIVGIGNYKGSVVKEFEIIKGENVIYLDQKTIEMKISKQEQYYEIDAECTEGKATYQSLTKEIIVDEDGRVRIPGGYSGIARIKISSVTDEHYYGTECEVTINVKSDSNAITPKPVHAHKYGIWKTVKKPTVFEEGRNERICNECGEIESEKISKLQPMGSLNLNSILLKERQKTNVLKVSGLATGDYIKSYSSSNKKVFTVSSGGKITAKKKGTATLTVTLASGKQLKAKVKVQKGTVKTSKISVKEKNVSLKKGKKYQIKASISPLTSQEKVIYSTLNKKIATVDKKGKVVAKKKGKAVITVKSGKKKIKVKITVK